MGSEDRDVVGACPVDCPDTCSWRVTVRDGEPVRLRATTDHPFTAGQLCVKLNGYLRHRLHPDRLLYPLRRTGPKGSGEFERISWDDALAEIADRWRDILDRRGGSAIWPYWSTGTLGQVQGYNVGARLWNVLNTAQHLSTICTRAGVVATVEMLGRAGGHDPERISDASAVVLWGTNPPVSGHHLWPVVERARAKGAPLVVIDPVRTLAAQRADLYLAPRPGTDAALAHAVANALICSGLHDGDWVAQHTNGFEDYARFVAAWTTERAAAETGLDVGEIQALIDVIATHRPTALRIGVGLQRHAGGGSAVQALTALGLITGDLRHPGGGPLYVTTGMFPWNEAAVQRPDLRTVAGPQLASTRLGTHLAERGPDGPLVEALWVMNANPAASNPDQRAVRAGLGREDLFTVVALVLLPALFGTTAAGTSGSM